VQSRYYDGNRFFRVLPTFVVQWGINGDPAVSAAWGNAIGDDANVLSNVRGTVSYAADATANDGSFPSCKAAFCAMNRTTQIFINYRNNSRLDDMNFTPFAVVVQGMDVVDAFYSGYGECADVCNPPNATRCPGPDQGRIYEEGNAYLEASFPLLSYTVSARVIDHMPEGLSPVILALLGLGGVIILAAVVGVSVCLWRRSKAARRPGEVQTLIED
jgi:peptidyl-prolyl cis-trans isomerase A (cyclophilin A)